MRQLYRFPGFPVEMAVDGEPGRREDMMMLVIANARVFGGGFRIAPRPTCRRAARRRRLREHARRSGPDHALAPARHPRHGPRGAPRRAATFRLRFAGPPAYETDGEWNRAGSSELTIGTRPAALRVLVPSPA